MHATGISKMKLIKHLTILLLTITSSTSVLAKEPFAIIEVINATNCYISGDSHRSGMGTIIEVVSGPNNQLSVLKEGEQGKVAIFEDETQLYALLDFYDSAGHFRVTYTPGAKKYIVSLEGTKCGVFESCVTFSANNPCI